MEDIQPKLDTFLKTIGELSTDFQTLNEHQISYNQYLETSQVIYNIFCQQMKDVTNECIRNCSILKNIQYELEIAYETRRFDSTNMFEIRTDSQKLLKNLEKTKRQNETIQNDIENIVKLISDEKEIEDSKLFNRLCRFVDKTTPEDITEIAPVCFVVVSALTFHPNDYTFKKIAVGAFFTGALVKTIIHCKAHEAKMLSELINSLIRHMSHLQQHSKEFGSFVSTVVNKLINSINSAEKNITYSLFTGVRVEKLAGKMLKEIIALRTGFFQVELKARALSNNTIDFFKKKKKNESNN